MKYFKKLEGECVYISPMNPEDAETYAKWLNNSNISNDLFINFGEMIDDEIITKLVEIIFEWEKESESIEEFKKLVKDNITF